MKRTIELALPEAEYEQLAAVAQERKRTVTEVAESAVVEWLEQQIQLEQARSLMRELGQGLGASRTPPHDVAREHDAYLYGQQDQE